MDLTKDAEITKIAKVLTQGDTHNLCLPLEGNGLSIKSHLTMRDKASWIIIQRKLLAMSCLPEVFVAINKIEGVRFSVSELAKMLLGLEVDDTLRSQLNGYAV